MMDSGVYDDSVDLCIYSDSEEENNLKIADDHCLGKYDKVNLKNIKMGSEANLFTDACLLSRAERALRQVRDSYNDLRIKEETITHGRSDLGPLTGRFDKACRLSKSYYFSTSGKYDMEESNAISDFKKVSLNGLDLDCGSFTKNDDEDDRKRLTRTSRKREDFVESLKKLFNSQLSKYGSATGSLCSMTSSDYSSWSNGREESADESSDFLSTEEKAVRHSDREVCPRKSDSFVDLEHAVEGVEKLCSSVEPAVRESERSSVDVPKDENVEEDSRISRKPERRIELDIEETMPKLNWDFLEQELEKAILKEKSVSSQLRDEILRKMAHEAKNEEEDDDEDAGNSTVDRSKIYRLSCGSCDDLSVYQQQPLPTLLSQPAAVTTPTSTTTVGFKGALPLFRRPPRKSRMAAGPINQLQVCFVNELSIEEDEASSAATTLTTPGDTFDRRLVPSHHQSQEQQLQLFPPSEYSTLNSETFHGEDCDGKSLGLASQTTKHSSDSCKSSLHPIPALNCLPLSLVDIEDNFFTKQARLQAEARIALAQVRPMSYMQFLLEKQMRKEVSNVVQYDLPGLKKWSDLRAMCPQTMGGFNTTHLKIIINHFLSEITHLNEELMNLLLERDDLYIVQDSMLVDIEDFTRRAEEWEYKKLIGSRQGMATPPSSPVFCSSPVMTSGSVLGRR